MYLQTLSWSSVSPKNNIHISPSIQIFCKDVNNKSYYVRIKALSTILVEFNDLTDDDLIDMYKIYQPEQVAASAINNTIYMRDATLENYKNFDKEIKGFIQDPQGLLSSFWKARNIKPYGWIFIEEYEFLKKKYTNCDIEITTSEEYIHNFSSDVILSTNKLFWDIEVFSPDRNFTDATNPTHEIFMISAITVINDNVTAYILTTKNTETFQEIPLDFPVDDLKNHLKEVNFKKYKTEKDLINGFFYLWREVNPDKCMTYNGDSYDIPYILDRAKLLKISIPPLSKLLSSSLVTTLPHPSPLGVERDKTIISPGVEKLDLVTYFRRLYPGNENYRLETTGKLYLGEGKSGLDIEEMFKIVESNDPIKMKIVSLYSYQDSMLLYNLWNKLNIEKNIENICNDIYCTSEELLRLSEEDLISRMVYHADFGTSLIAKTFNDISYLIPFKIGTYSDVYVNKYDELFALALSMNTSNVEYIDIIRDRIKFLPTYMKSMIIYSIYVPLDIRNHLESVINDIPDVIAIDDNFIYTKNPIVNLGGQLISRVDRSTRKNLSLVDKYDYLFVISPSSRIIYKNGIFIRIGLHTISRPKYEYMKILIDKYLLDYIAGKKVNGRRITNKELLTVDKNLFIINVKVKPLNSYKDKRLIKYKIAERVNNTTNVTTWVNVKYVNTRDGFEIIDENVDDKIILDYKSYIREINEIYKILDTITK